MKVKLISYILILLLILTCQFSAFSQTQKTFPYNAELITKKGVNVERKSVGILQENGMLKISGVKDKTIAKAFPYSAIKNADYTYSEKPQIKEAIVVALVTNNWLMGLPFAFNKTKKHWLVLITEKETFLLELEKDSYRRLLFEMNSNGIKVEDLGDRDRKEEPPRHPKPDADYTEDEFCGDGIYRPV